MADRSIPVAVLIGAEATGRVGIGAMRRAARRGRRGAIEPAAMQASREKLVIAALVAVLVGGLFVVHAWRQVKHLNLSATAGGQYPYLVYAKGIAEAGPFGHLGDRNRMPLVPAVTAFVYTADWDRFVARAARLAVFISLAALGIIGAMAWHTLPGWSAAALVVFSACCVFADQAAFVQAELLFYALFFAGWLLVCRLLRRPHPGWAAATGAVLALAYLTKASALLLAGLAVAALLIRAAVRMVRGPAAAAARSDAAPAPAKSAADSPGRFALAALLLGAVFLAIVFPYVQTNRARFGRYFYNVNSTFFMWCDSWEQASDFAERYAIDRGYPNAPAEEIPSLSNYLRTHDGQQVLGRLRYGFRALGQLAWEGTGLKYLLLLAGGCVLLGCRREAWRGLSPADGWAAGFTVLLLAAYTIVYAWYVPIGFGDRFLLSLYVPLGYALLRGCHALARGARRLLVQGPGSDPAQALAAVLVVLIAGEFVFASVSAVPAARPAFVRFYYNESLERLRAGDLVEAEKGFRGVARLDPSFAAAHRELGMIALHGGRMDDAVLSLTRAVELRPTDADLRNSLGSALVQAGRMDEARVAFRRAVAIAPGFATAWFNLGGTCAALNLKDEAREAIRRLESLDPSLAGRLVSLISSGE